MTDKKEIRFFGLYGEGSEDLSIKFSLVIRGKKVAQMPERLIDLLKEQYNILKDSVVAITKECFENVDGGDCIPIFTLARKMRDAHETILEIKGETTSSLENNI